MLKILFKMIKRVVISSFLLYGYNLIMQPLGFIIPINLLTVGAITILGIPALLSLIFILVFVF